MKHPILPALPADCKYVVIGPYVWGADPDFTVALKNARKEYGKALTQYIVFAAHEKVRLDDMGSFVWLPEECGTTFDGPNPYHEVLRVGFKAKP